MQVLSLSFSFSLCCFLQRYTCLHYCNRELHTYVIDICENVTAPIHTHTPERARAHSVPPRRPTKKRGARAHTHMDVLYQLINSALLERALSDFYKKLIYVCRKSKGVRVRVTARNRKGNNTARIVNRGTSTKLKHIIHIILSLENS